MALVVKKEELVKALVKVGFYSIQGHGKHLKYVYDTTDSRIGITIIVPKGSGPLPIGTSEKSRKRLLLDHAQFKSLIECPMKANEFAEHMSGWK